MTEDSRNVLAWLVTPRIPARGRFSRGGLLLSALVAVHVTILAATLLKQASISNAIGAVLVAWIVLLPALAMIGAVAFLGIAFASIQWLRPNLIVYVLAGMLAGATHFWLGTLFSLKNQSNWMVLLYMVGGFWMSNPTSSGAVNLVGFHAQVLGGAFAGMTFAFTGTKEIVTTGKSMTEHSKAA